jgi:GR25 family glycosyltransferase involved in LPS biosynthesis
MVRFFNKIIKMNRILVISSPSPIRQANVHKQFASQTVEPGYELVPAVMMAVGRYGIAKSHKKAVQLAKDRGWGRVCIAEDDLNLLSPDSLRIYFETMERLPDDWDMFAAGLFSGELVEPNTALGYSGVT